MELTITSSKPSYELGITEKIQILVFLYVLCGSLIAEFVAFPSIALRQNFLQ